jgi:hypothetical protein
MHAAVERARKRREQEELDLQAKTKAAAMMKLKALEEKGRSAGEKTEDNNKESIVEKPTTDSVESRKPEREPRGEQDKVKDDKEWEREHQSEPSPDSKHYRVEDTNRRRNDSDSSDASRSSGSRQYFHHQQRNIPPRFQQQRQQQQQQYHQQQLYQATHPMPHPQREFFDVPPPHIADSGKR